MGRKALVKARRIVGLFLFGLGFTIKPDDPYPAFSSNEALDANETLVDSGGP